MQHSWLLVLALALALALALGAPVAADVLETRDGRVLKGSYLGGTQQSVRFKSGDEVEVFLTEEVLALTFSGPAARPKTSKRPTPAAKPQKAAKKPAAAKPRQTAEKPAAEPKSPPAKPAPARKPRQAAAQPAPSEKSRRAAAKSAPAEKPRKLAKPAPAEPPQKLAKQPRAVKPTPPAAAETAPAPRQQANAPAAPAPEAPAGPAVARVPAGTSLRVRMLDGIDSRRSAQGDRFSATLEGGLEAGGVSVLRPGSRLYGQIAELRSTGPIPNRLKLELTQLMLQGELVDIVTGTQQQAQSETPDGPAAQGRPGVPAGSVLEFRLLQPFEVRLR